MNDIIGSSDIDDVVIEHSGYVCFWELVIGVTDEKTCLSDSTITNNDQFNILFVLSLHI